jgi:hypothetical protein
VPFVIPHLPLSFYRDSLPKAKQMRIMKGGRKIGGEEYIKIKYIEINRSRATQPIRHRRARAVSEYASRVNEHKRARQGQRREGSWASVHWQLELDEQILVIQLGVLVVQLGGGSHRTAVQAERPATLGTALHAPPARSHGGGGERSGAQVTEAQPLFREGNGRCESVLP